jgi:4-amino-4-deoxy-L-arabinose transferase-like glycosyltransferase
MVEEIDVVNIESSKIEVEKRKKILEERIKVLLNNKYNIFIIGIIVLAFLIRLYFFTKTIGQPLWWDEAEYMAGAKHWALGFNYDINPQRPPLFQLLGALLLMIGLGESTLKFLLVLIPSTFLIFATYLLGKELFDENTGIFAALGITFVWSYLFWTERFQPDFFSISSQLLSLFFFWKLFKYDKTKFAIAGGFFAALAFYFKISALLVPLSLFVFIIIKDGLLFIKNRNYWYALLIFFVTLIPFFIFQYIMYGSPLAFAPSYADPELSGRAGRALGWMTLDFFISLPKVLFFGLFIIGLIMAIGRILITSDLILKSKQRRTDPEIFCIVALATIAWFYIFYIKGTIEDRWVFLIVPFIFFFSARAAFYIITHLKKINKYLPLIFIFLIFAVFAYTQLTHTSELIEIKKESYIQVKDASIWMKENSNKEDILLSVSQPQTAYYSERETYSYARMNESLFFDLINNNNPKYILFSVIEPHHPEWLFSWAPENPDKLIPRQAFYIGQTPVAMVYEVNYSYSF